MQRADRHAARVVAVLACAAARTDGAAGLHAGVVRRPEDMAARALITVGPGSVAGAGADSPAGGVGTDLWRRARAHHRKARRLAGPVGVVVLVTGVAAGTGRTGIPGLARAEVVRAAAAHDASSLRPAHAGRRPAIDHRGLASARRGHEAPSAAGARGTGVGGQALAAGRRGALVTGLPIAADGIATHPTTLLASTRGHQGQPHQPDRPLEVDHSMHGSLSKVAR